MNTSLIAFRAAGIAVGLVAAAAPLSADAQVLPPASQIVRNTDLECYKADPEPPPAPNVLLRHLNPMLNGLQQQAQLDELERVCLPVQKNDQRPPEQVLRYNQWFDLACYKASAAPVDLKIDVRHLNPVLAGLPDESVRIKELKQLCVPVRKRRGNNVPPIPDDVRRVAQFFDVACYKLDTPTSDAQFNLTLAHLNPLVRTLGLEDRKTRMRRAFQLCLPVTKNNLMPPDDVLQIVRGLDFLRYRLDPIPPVDFYLGLRHMNPLYSNRPWFRADLSAPPRVNLLVPVRKLSVQPGSGD